MRHSLTQLLAASSGGESPSAAAWQLPSAGPAPAAGGGDGGEEEPGGPRPKQQRWDPAVLEQPQQGAEEPAEHEDLFSGLELGDLLEAAPPHWELDVEPSGCFCGQQGEPEPPTSAPGQRSCGASPGGVAARSRLKAAAAARLNRLKKKQYVLGLESRLQGLAAENRQLRDRNRGLNRRLRDLERETSYLRAVLANQSALGQLLSRLAGAGGLRLRTSLFRDTDPPHQHPPQAGESRDHDYALPSQDAGESEGEERPASGGICLHVDRDQLSVEFCSLCARRACASFKIFFFRCLPCQAPLCRG
ncbi:CREB/ATF bZIP transcription factor [Gopherus evgoodei]|uniref:CREB/ATF bZIP transcription factor n=1 Tax=Gopherus evgoodei TaxID=1825980 RepID=A0A8C4XWZ6_9SAUR|nr:CREB/ATF bZIP transcription factor [Gopherus evgoodei]